MEEIKRLNHTLENLDIAVRFSLIKEISIDYLIEITDRLEEIMNMKQIDFVCGRGKRKHKIQRHYDFFKESAMKMWKYAMHLDLCGERNSFSKTDPDATFMHMKYDYYNHTNVFKPGYNVQMGISDGYIRHMYISSDANDLNTYIPFMKGYYEAYGKYPTKTPADAGYEFEVESERIETRGIYPRKIEKLVNSHCEGCPLKEKCTTSKKGRIIRRCRELENYQDKVRSNMESEEGKKLMTQRSIVSEGTFGNLKENWRYSKLRRRGESGVKTEIYLMGIGVNLRKYHQRKVEKMKQVNKMLAQYLH